VIIRKYSASTLLLDAVVLAMTAPPDDRFLVTPRRKREDPSPSRFAFEALVIDKTVDRFEHWFQVLRERKILIFSCVRWLNFESHDKHRSLSLSFLPYPPEPERHRSLVI
jgi:hypothetical protein